MNLYVPVLWFSYLFIRLAVLSKVFVLQSHMNLRSSFRSFRSERFLGHIWMKSSLGLSTTDTRQTQPISGNPGESVPGDSNDSKAKHPKHPIQSKHIETTCRALEAKRWWTKSRIPSRPLRPASSTLWSTSCVSADSLQILCRFCNLETLSASNLLWILFEISNITASWELRRTCGQTPKQLPWDSKCKNANLRQLRHSCFCLRALQVGWIKV